jgi:DNA polymerase-3 subunit alpha
MDLEIDSEDHIFYANGIATSNSHAVSYAYMAYWSAYLKAHYPIKFYLHWLRNANEKLDPDKEVYELVESAKIDKIKVNVPSIEYIDSTFSIHDDEIYFGFTDVKNVGDREFLKIKDKLTNVDHDCWLSILVYALADINKRAVQNLISVGTFSKFRLSRSQMLHELSCVRELSTKELEKLRECLNKDLSLRDNLALLNRVKKEGGAVATARRLPVFAGIIDRLDNPGRSLKDNPLTISIAEENLLGTPISYSKTDSCADAGHANTSCKEIKDGKSRKSILAVEIVKFREHVTKSNEKMCFLTVRDSTIELENVVLFPEQYAKFEDIIYETATVLLFGEKAKNRDSFLVNKVISI